MEGYENRESRLDFSDAPTLDDEVREQVQEVFHFRSVERFLPEERGFE